jgi:hypothetical protein
MSVLDDLLARFYIPASTPGHVERLWSVSVAGVVPGPIDLAFWTHRRLLPRTGLHHGSSPRELFTANEGTQELGSVLDRSRI